jgi:hypothetical protein
VTVRWAAATVLALAASAPVACGGDDEPPPLQSVSCLVYYRPLGDASTEGAVEETVVLDLTGGSGRAERTVDFETMSFRASVTLDEFEGDSISIAVNASDDETLASVLYQLGELDLADVQFVGEHGFTGLHYVDHLGTQLQFACSAA